MEPKQPQEANLHPNHSGHFHRESAQKPPSSFSLLMCSLEFKCAPSDLLINEPNEELEQKGRIYQDAER